MAVPSVKCGVALDALPTSSYNMLTENQASLEDNNTSGWEAQLNCTLTASVSTSPPHGQRALRMTASSAARMIAKTTAATRFRVGPGLTYTAIASFRAAATARTCYVGIKFYERNGDQIIIFTGGDTELVYYGTGVADTTTGWTQATDTEVAPEGAYWATVHVLVDSPANAEVHDVDAIGLFFGTNTTFRAPSSPPPYVAMETTGDISLDAATAGGISAELATSHTFSHTIGSGSNRLLLVSVGLETASSTTIAITGATYNGLAMTLAAEIETIEGSNTNRTAIFYLLDANLPAAGTYNVVATVGAYPTAGRIIGAAASLFGVKQTTPSVVATGSSNTDTTTPSTAITTTEAGSWVYDALGAGQPVLASSANAGQTLRTNQAGGSAGSALHTSTKVMTISGATTLGYTEVSTQNRYTHVLTAWAPAVTGTRLTRDFTSNRGRQSNLDRDETGEGTVNLDNQDRALDPNHATGPYYGKLLPERQARLYCTIPAGITYSPAASTKYISSPDHADFTLASGFDIRAKLNLPDWTVTNGMGIVSKWSSGAGQRSWRFSINDLGVPYIDVSSDGTATSTRTGTHPVPWLDATQHWIRAKYNGTTGTTQFFTSENGVFWRQLGTDVTGTAVAPFNSTTEVRVGHADSSGIRPIAGTIYEVKIYDTHGFNLYASPSFDVTSSTVTSVVDDQGKTWTINGTYTLGTEEFDIINGYVDGWTQEWEGAGKRAIVPLRFQDALKILGRRRLPSVWESVVRNSAPNAWWRQGEGDGTMMVDTAGYRHGTRDGDTTSVSTSGLVEFDPDTAVTLDGVLATSPARTTVNDFTPSNPFTFEFFVNASDPQPSVSPDLLVFFSNSSGTGFAVFFNSGKIRFSVAASPGVSAIYESSASILGERTHVAVRYSSAGQTIFINGVEDASLVLGVFDGTVAFTDGILNVGGTITNTIYSGVLDEIVYYDQALSSADILAHYQAGTTPWSGDLPGPRIDRVLDLALWPDPMRNLPSGVTELISADTFGSPAVLEAYSAVTAERGRLYADSPGYVSFVPRHSFSNDVAFNTPAAYFHDGTGTGIQYREVTFASDDLLLRTIVRSQRRGGSVVEVGDPADELQFTEFTLEELDLEIASDLEVEDRANYLLNLYSTPRQSIHSLTFRPTTYADWRTLLSLELGQRVQVTRTPPGGGSAIVQDCLIDHIEHDGNPTAGSWDVTLTLSPADTISSWVLDSPTHSVLGSTTRPGF